MQPVRYRYCSHLAYSGAQIGIGVASGVLFAKIHPFVTVFGGALLGSASGAISGFVGRIVVVCRSETENEAMQKIIDGAVNSLVTVILSLIGHCTCMALGGGLGRKGAFI